VVGAHQAAGAPRLFRPPYGEINVLTLLYVWLAGRELVLWNVNPRDFEAQAADTVVTALKRDVGVGSVALLHDGRSGAPGDANVTVNAVRVLLADERARALRLTTVTGAARA
jgi:peptidoglycan/xylan/chitin deacetylase (PgdA/CDA1 family)